MSRPVVHREAANGSLVPPDHGPAGHRITIGWRTNDRAKRGPCHGPSFTAKRRTGHWCPPTTDRLDIGSPLDGAPMTERSEVHVTARRSPRSGERVTGAPRPRTGWTSD